MKTAISILSIFWILLALLLFGEPTEQSSKVPQYVGWVYIILLFGLPFVIIKMLERVK